MAWNFVYEDFFSEGLAEGLNQRVYSYTTYQYSELSGVMAS